MSATRDFLDTVELQLMDATERGAGAGGLPGPRRPRRHGRRRELLTVLPALAAAAVILLIVLGIATGGGASGHHGVPASRRSHRGSVQHQRTVTVTVTVPRGTVAANPNGPSGAQGAPAGPVPAGFVPRSFTAISETEWWLLGTAPCSSPPCTSIVRTDNGGRSFVGIPAPRTDGVSELRFADARNGFAFDPQLWVTHDAGASWQPASLGGGVTDLEAAGGYVYAVAGGTLFRAAVGGGVWQPERQAPAATGGLWAQGPQVLVVDAGRVLMQSGDAGAAFRPQANLPSSDCTVQAPEPPTIWASCGAGASATIERSTTAGTPLFTNVTDAVEAGPAFAAASGTVAETGGQKLYRTTNGGLTWHPVTPVPAGVTEWSYLGFTDPTHGVAIGRFGTTSRLYYTTDGGQSYHPVTIR